MKMTEFFLAQLDAEAAPTRRTLERVPAGKDDWKPHPKSMPMGYLAALCARLPSWVALTINTDEHDLRPKDGSASAYTPRGSTNAAELVKMLDQAVAEARAALSRTDDDHLMKPWKLLVGGQVVSQDPRYVVLRSAVFNHLAHHRGQLTVYLRLNEVAVPAIYGPSADDQRF
jgi:uncharacterized damage-inducible protein DinB